MRIILLAITLALAGCQNLTPTQRAAITAAEARGANRAIAALHSQLDAIAGSGASGKAIVPAKVEK